MELWEIEVGMFALEFTVGKLIQVPGCCLEPSALKPKSCLPIEVIQLKVCVQMEDVFVTSWIVYQYKSEI